MSTDVPLKVKNTAAAVDFCLDLKCVFTKVSIYSEIYCMSGWAIYIN